MTEFGYRHQEISLLPRSTDPGYEPLVLSREGAAEMRVLAEFERVLGN